MKRELLTVPLQNPLLCLGIAAVSALIFIADTVTNLEIAVAVLYVAVVLMSMRFGRLEIVVWVGAICILLTVVSYLFTPHGAPEAGLVNCGLSILAIGGTTYLATAIQVLDKKAEQTHAELAHMSRVMTIGELTASIAHEVSQPLSAIIANAGAAKRWLSALPPQHEEAQHALDRILADGDRAGEVIARARRLFARTAPSRDRVDINAIILETIALTHNKITTNHIVLRTELADDLPVVVGDRIQLQQVVLNYIVNAVEALSGRDANPRDLLVSSATDGKKVTISVRDTGVGIAAQKFDRVFEPFFTTKTAGIGMGLSISRSIVEAHGGAVYAAPNFPRGAVFGFTLPIKVRS